jgi:glycosyltransferase involved in cell wall biosynthesis
MAQPILSIVIPTHKRAAILKKCLEHIERQTIADQIEVIVVSDGPDEATKNLMGASSFQLLASSYFEIPKSHQGVARNKGTQEAKGEMVLFIGDDIFLEPDACEKHLAAHSSQLAVLGFTTWDPSIEITPVMKWLERTGWQFGYPMLKKYEHDFIPSNIQHRFTYTSNISVPTAIAKKFPFRTDVRLYGWEDILWGQQLRTAGIKLFYEPDAKAFHHHHITLEDSLKRMETLGRSLKHLSAVEPGLDRMPTGLKMLAYQLIALTPTMRGKHYRALLLGLSRK